MLITIIIVLVVICIGLPLAVRVSARIWFREQRKHVLKLMRGDHDELER